MTRVEIEAKVVDILSSQLSVEKAEIQAGSRLMDDLGIDSFAFVEILYAFEEAFDMKIPDEDLGAVKTVGDVVDYVERRSAAA